MCARMLLERPLAASTVFMVQEAGPYLYELLRRSKAHTAHYAEVPGGQMAVLTLVPKTLEATAGAHVRIVPFRTSPMRRQFHVVFVPAAGVALVNAHLESCRGGAWVREEQVREIGAFVASARGEYRYGIFGDLNGYTNRKDRGWLSHVPHTLDVTYGPALRFPSLSPHKLRAFAVR
jgi:hypothetical protein